MLFTIWVEEKSPMDRGISLKGLQLQHGECQGGEIEIDDFYQHKDRDGERISARLSIDDAAYEDYIPMWRLTCARCRAERSIASEPEAAEILKTAFDGLEREVKDKFKVVRKP